ncbi:MAG TPA: hypothetical protein VD858_06285 [Reyranella sp.]|nr:hypothetical protein [Reyranella sp.]
MRWSVLVVPLLLAGCSSDWMRGQEASVQTHSVFPQNYRTEIVALMHTYLNDPTGVRDAFVSEPSQRTIEGISRYVSCVRYNAKKTGGQYAGSKDSMVLFRGGRLERVIDNEMARGLCKDAAYTPFPELQQMSR